MQGCGVERFSFDSQLLVPKFVTESDSQLPKIAKLPTSHPGVRRFFVRLPTSNSQPSKLLESQTLNSQAPKIAELPTPTGLPIPAFVSWTIETENMQNLLTW